MVIDILDQLLQRARATAPYYLRVATRAGKVYDHFSNTVILSPAAQYIQAGSELGQRYGIT